MRARQEERRRQRREEDGSDYMDSDYGDEPEEVLFELEHPEAVTTKSEPRLWITSAIVSMACVLLEKHRRLVPDYPQDLDILDAAIRIMRGGAAGAIHLVMQALVRAARGECDDRQGARWTVE